MAISAAPGRTEYVLTGSGEAGVGHVSHVELWRTRDDGGSFQRVSTPPLGGDRALDAPIFLDPEDGYATTTSATGDREVLWSTWDAARTWRRSGLRLARGDVVSEVVGGQGTADVVARGCHAGGCRARVLTSAAGSDHWRQVAGLSFTGDTSGAVSIAGYDASLWILRGVDTPHASTQFSSDGGRTYRPVHPYQGIDCSADATSTTVLWTTCSTGMMLAFHWADLRGSHDVPLEASGTGETSFVPLTDEEAYVVSPDDAEPALMQTTDEGRTFHRVARLPAGRTRRSDLPVTVAFASPAYGLAVVDGHRIFRTTDAGHTWHRAAAIPGL